MNWTRWQQATRPTVAIPSAAEIEPSLVLLFNNGAANT